MKRFAIFFSTAVFALSLAAGITPVHSQEDLEKEGSEIKPESKEEFKKGMEEFGEREKVPPVSIKIEETKEKPAAKPGYGGWGMPLPMLFLTNLSGLDRIADDSGVPHFADEMFLVGGRGYGVIGGCLRIGGLGGGMGQTNKVETAGGEKSVEFSIGFGGLTLEYFRSFGRFEFSVGALLGGGGVSIKRYINSELIEPLGEESAAFFAGEPFITAKYKILDWFGIEANAGYLMARVSSDSLRNVTDSDFSGFIFSLAPTFGYTTVKKIEE